MKYRIAGCLTIALIAAIVAAAAYNAGVFSKMLNKGTVL